MIPQKKYVYKYPRPMLTVDAVVFRQTAERLEVLVIERGKPPFEGSPALPGGFVEMDEDLIDAAKRELFEETGLRNIVLHQLGTYGNPARDPRGRTVSVVYVGILKKNQQSTVTGGDDATRAYWIPARNPGTLAFDHNAVLRDALKWLRLKE